MLDVVFSLGSIYFSGTMQHQAEIKQKRAAVMCVFKTRLYFYRTNQRLPKSFNELKYNIQTVLFGSVFQLQIRRLCAVKRFLFLKKNNNITDFMLI